MLSLGGTHSAWCAFKQGEAPQIFTLEERQPPPQRLGFSGAPLSTAALRGGRYSRWSHGDVFAVSPSGKLPKLIPWRGAIPSM